MKILSPRELVPLLYYLSNRLYVKYPSFRVASRLIWRLNVHLSGCYIEPSAKIGKALCLPHPTGIVIGSDVIIGSNVRIYQNVTIGRKDFRDLCVPRIGNDVVISAGAVVLGDISIGDEVIIGANSVVISDVESGAVVVGIPARAIRKE